MTDDEVKDMQRRIDEGIRLAQQRLWKRAGNARQSLVVLNDGKLQEIIPQVGEKADSVGDPLNRHL